MLGQNPCQQESPSRLLSVHRKRLSVVMIKYRKGFKRVCEQIHRMGIQMLFCEIMIKLGLDRVVAHGNIANIK